MPCQKKTRKSTTTIFIKLTSVSIFSPREPPNTTEHLCVSSQSWMTSSAVTQDLKSSINLDLDFNMIEILKF